jgi:hypothetical protein
MVMNWFPTTRIAHPMNICLWRYKDNARNYPGYHLSADAAGCLVLRKILSGIRDRVEIPTQTPDARVLAVPNNQDGAARTVSAQRWRIETKSTYPSDHFRFGEIGKIFRLECSMDQLQCVIGGIEDIERGCGDYCVGGDGNHVLWFW